MGRIEGRVAVITGAGDGIGRGIARRFAAEGAKILVAELNADAGEHVAAELRDSLGADAVAQATDVANKEQVGAMIEAARDRWGTVDILVNNAWGGGGLGRVELKPDLNFERGFGVGFFGPLWAMQAAFPLMRAQGRGNVINLCSLNGVNAHIGTAEYNSAKEALRSLSRTAAREWAPHGIIVNVICPAAKSAAFHAVMARNPELVAGADAANPMGYLGDPERDIAPVALFLASDDAHYLTGNTLFVDGGSHINGAHWNPELPDRPN
ncbi:MAG TPA: SDR family oxidoreductase [Ilumatobacteraceae bacterium]|jgi:NAD(P)-dependent dehydrogenase (short-subunit alcohol dehydrogenase family)